MKIITLISLFFCLAITTILAQITLDGNTTTSTTDVSGNILINIATPVNGLSNNTYREFNGDASYDIFFNNDASNPNFTDGDRASIIVNQVTSNSPSILEGRIQVSGHGAKIIIANPNGITCNGCYFVSVTGVDLVTGTYDIDNGTYSISDNDITLGSGGLAGSNLNIQTNNLNISSSGGVITDTLNLNLAGDFNNSGAILASFGINITATDFNNSGTITIDNEFNIAVDGFDITATNFTNSGTITVNGDLNAMVDSFSNQAGATINATTDGCNIVYTTSYTDAGTSNCLDSVGGTIVFHIATPVDGLSYNQVEDFDVNSYGTILNNSASGGTAQLEDTAVIANPNFTAGSEEASLILFQVTKSSGSALNGTIEVFGGEAGLIIANPNGIDCDGCAFTNVNRVDLVTGNYDLNTNILSSIAATNIDIASSRLTAPVLKIQTGANFNNAGEIVADTVTIEVTNFASNISNAGTVSSTNLNFILTEDFTHNSASFNGFNNFSNLTVSTDGAFTNNDTIDPIGNLTITAASFNNTGGVVNADTFALSVADDFDYGTITANTSNLQVGGDFSYDDAASDFTWNANDSLVVSGNADITTNNYTQSGAITVDGVWTINAHTDFTYSNTNNDFIWDTNDSLTVGRNANIVAAGFANSGTINVTNSSFDITATNFTNTGTISANTTLNTTVTNTSSGSFNNTGGVVNADTFNLDVAGDFDFADKGTLTTTAFNLDVGGNFSNNDTNNDFTWRATDTLTVSGNASIDTASFNNSGTITVKNSFDIIAAADFDNSGTINVTNIFDIMAAADFANSGTINVNNSSFDIIAAADFTNAGTISANSFNAIVNSFSNRARATITAGECNIVATTSSDNGVIICLDSIDTTITNIAVPENGLSINSYETFHIPNSGVIFNNSDSDATSQLVGSISANPNVSQDAASIILAQVTSLTDISLLAGALEVVGAEAVVIIANPNGINCNACSFINASRVDLVTGNYNTVTESFESIANGNIAIIENGLDASSVGILNIHAGGFTNTGVLQANIFNLFVDDFDYNDKGTLTTTAFNLEVDDVFSYEDESIGFVWEENDTLTVLGSANINTNNFINHGAIDIAGSGSFEIAVDYTAINQGSIVSENGSLNITTYDFFRNLTGGDIAVNSLNIIAGGKVTNTATIDVATLTITASDDSSRTNDRTGFYVSNRGNITATTLNITAVDNFYNRGNITATNFNITRAKDIFFLNKEIDSYDGTYDGGNISLNGDSSFRADGDIIENYGNIISLNGDSNFIADGGSIQNYGHISLTGDSSFIADGIIENYGHIISLNGNSSFIADGGSIQNYGHIDFGSNNLDISADSFTNHEDATIDAATLNLTVSSYIDDGTIDAVVSNNGSIIDVTNDQ